VILGDIFERNAALYGAAPAIYFEDRVVTHAQLLTRACQLGNALANQGLRQGDRVLMLAQNCLEYLEVIAAVGLTGLTSVGLNYRLSAREQLHIIEDCSPSVWIFEAQYAARVEEICRVLHTPPTLICIGALPAAFSLHPLDYNSLLAQSLSTRPTMHATEQDRVFLVYTSGTTGKPKGVIHTQQGQLEQLKICSSAFGAQPEDRALLVMPFYHLGVVSIFLSYAWTGATLVLHRAFEAKAIFASFAQHRVTVALLAPVMIQMMLDEPEEVRQQPNDLHTIFYSSAPMPVPLLKRAIHQFGLIFVQVYGMTESMLGTYMYKYQHKLQGEPHEIKRLASAGQPYFGVKIVVRREDDSLCDTNEVGEITVFSHAVMQGYWNNHVATHQTLRDGWCYTGDMGYFDEEKYLFLVDRKKDMIISGGENIYSREVEEALLTHPLIFETAVIGVPDEKWGETVLAFVVCRGAQPSESELIEHCRSQIASYKKPSAIRFIDALPRISSTNKVDKKKLREPGY